MAALVDMQSKELNWLLPLPGLWIVVIIIKILKNLKLVQNVNSLNGLWTGVKTNKPVVFPFGTTTMYTYLKYNAHIITLNQALM